MDERHDIDFGRIYPSGVLTAHEEFVQVWCNRHGRYEWHWISDGVGRRSGKVAVSD